MLFLLLAWPAALSVQAARAPEPSPSSSVEQIARFQVGVGGLFGAPFGDLGHVVGRTGGVGFEFAYRFSRAPLVVGFEGQIQQYSTVSTLGTVTGIDPPVVITSPVSNASLGGYVVTRLERRHGLIRPYTDGVIGINYVCARCAGSDDDTPEVLKTRTLGVGLGGGVALRLGANVENRDEFMLDVRVRYLHAPSADYLMDNLTVASASTNMLQVYVGLLVF
jgi:hypothetical protein